MACVTAEPYDISDKNGKSYDSILAGKPNWAMKWKPTLLKNLVKYVKNYVEQQQKEKEKEKAGGP